MLATFETYSNRIARMTEDGLFFAGMGGNALHDADLILVALSALQFPDIHDTIKRDRPYAMRDEAVRKVSQAIEDAE